MFRAILVVLLSAACTATPDGDQKAFKDFVKRFNKQYASAHEYSLRFGIFSANYKFINEENLKGTNLYALGVNHFSDLTPNEFATNYFGFNMRAAGNATFVGVHEYQNEVLADSVDWRTQNAVTPVKDQGQCGSCWSFSTTGALEGAWKIATSKLVSLSEEEFVQCDTGSSGCGGGSMIQAFQWAETQDTCTESSYPYTSGGGAGGSCKLTGNSCTVGIPKGGVTGYKQVGASTSALMSAVMQQPVSIAVEADKSVFQSYSSGIMDGACGTNLDHGILCIGYGTDNGRDYWIVKNSWGTVWGESGFGRLLRGKGGEGECGILAQAAYPVVSGSGPGPSPGPAPPPGPSPTPGPSPSPSSHYEQPPCQGDEVALEIQGFDGAMCSPECTTAACPTDVPEGTTDTPSCVLEDQSSGKKYCALQCLVGGCPPGASCVLSGFMGLCLYPASLTGTSVNVTMMPVVV